jgi:hypothetical protein
LGGTGLPDVFWSLVEDEELSPDSFVLVLAFRPSDEKKPAGDLPDLGDRTDDDDEREVLVDDWETVSDDGCAKDGYGRAGGPWGGLVSAP